MPRKKLIIPTDAAPVDSYKHKHDRRTRIPTQEESEKLAPKDKKPTKTKYQYDPSLDPQLVWAGKAEAGSEFGVSTVPIYVQEKVAPEAIIARLKQGAKMEQTTLFGDTAQDQFTKAISFYEHEDNWQNRMILGDSLLVMNSLLEKEKMRGKVQCVYIDPPYGIRFGSNWQASTKKRDVKDNKLDDMIRQPEQIKAFRDTWELGIHSYLSYLRDRLITARELLTETGSCFVQINDENVHLIRNLMDEVFGMTNFVCQITYRTKTRPLGAKLLEPQADYCVWYAKDVNKVKYRQLFSPKDVQGDSIWKWVQLPDGTRRQMTKEEINDHSLLPKESKVYRTADLRPAGFNSNCVYEFEFEGKKYLPPGNGSWITSEDRLQQLAQKGYLQANGKTLERIIFLNDFPIQPLMNVWQDTVGAGDKTYVVQTTVNVIQRCILMTTDPGDVVLDPTCGSGTSAYVAEQWGRRWVTIDTSRVAMALARTRLMTAKYPWYQLKEDNNIRSGFEYKTVPHMTLKSIASGEEPDQEVLYDQALENKEKIRVAGPFTVESLSPHRISDANEMLSSEHFIETVVSNLLKAGVQTGRREERLEFANLDILPSGPEVQASGEYKTKDGLKKVAVAIGPEFGSIDDDFIRSASRLSKRFADLLVVAGTSFEASAFAEPSEIEGLRVMKVKINPDLSMGDLLKKTGAGNLFLAFGEPEVKVKTVKDRCIVEVVGVDVYDPVKNEIRSSGSGDPEHEIAAWFIDTNYNGSAFFVTHAYFLGADKPYEKLKKALKADINEEVWDSLYSTVSRPFAKPTTGKIAVKVINHYGDEAMRIVEIK